MISERMKPLANSNSVIQAMFEEGKRLAAIHGAENVYDFSLGDLNVPAPTGMSLAACDIPKEEESAFVYGYISNAGYGNMRQAVIESLSRRFGTRFRRNNILMIVGAISDLNMILETLLNPGDEVITFAPYSVEYSNYVRDYNGSLMVISPDITDSELNLVGLGQKINARTKMVIINTSSNPTGAVYSLEIPIKMVDIIQAKEKKLGITITLPSDEPCRELAYDGTEVPYTANVYDNTAICCSCNKSLPLPGEHIGYLVIPDALKDGREVSDAAIIANRVLGCVNASSLMQRVIIRCLDARVNLEAYGRNRNLLYNRLKDLGFECIKPQGTFYLSVKPPETDGKKLCEDCKKYSILTVPGTSFACPGYVQISYRVSYEQIERSFPVFARAAADYGLKE